MSRSTTGDFDDSSRLNAGMTSGGMSNDVNVNPGTATDHDNVISELNSLLRGAISATETYRIALEKAADSDDRQQVGLLREIQEEHGRACQALRDRIRELGGEASDSSGAWGVWAKTVQSIGSLFGNNSALKALKEGEEHGLKDFQDALDDVDADSMDLIRNQLIPAQQRHIRTLDTLMESMK
jgi:uncharacterized protein (TIGR02284 family)